MADPERIAALRFVCARDRLADSGRAHGFSVMRAGRILPAIAYAFDGQAHAAINICPHRGTSLDWQPGEVFEESGLYLICATHGAMFDPDTGLCIAGPCVGAQLQKLPVQVVDGRVELISDLLVSPSDSDQA